MQPTRLNICLSFLLTVLLISALVHIPLTYIVRILQKVQKLDEAASDLKMKLTESTNCDNIDEATTDYQVKRCLEKFREELSEIRKQNVGPSSGKNVPPLRTDGCKADGSVFPDIAQPKGLNYASEVIGARIEDVVAEPVENYGFVRAWFSMKFTTNPPINVLRASMEPGNCFCFRNTSAILTVQLAKEIFVEFLELEHLSKERIRDIDTSNAPREFEAFYIETESCASEHNFGKFAYDNKTPRQYFAVQSDTKVEYIRFKFLSNHGNPAYTCVYRIGVYGRERA